MIEELERSVAELRSPYSADADRSQSLSLPATLSLVEQRQAELADLDRQLASLESTSARKGMEMERLQAENRQLEQQRLLNTKAAEEAQRRKAGLDSDGNDLERRGRWWKGVGEGLGEMLELEV
jgi:chromosome segregation ATPase